MGTPMPYQEKNIQSKRCALPLLLPIVESVLTKKPVPLDSSEENPLNFHLEMIKKIDRILEKHEQTISIQESDSQPPIVPTPPPTPVEPRPSLFKTQSHTEITWQPTRETPQISLPMQPEEFKTELSETPEFKFITSQEFNKTFLNLRPRPEDRIEIIDLSSFTEGTVLSSKLPGFIFTKPQGKEQPTAVPTKQPSTEQHRNKKIEVIDARTLTQKTYEDAFLAAEKQTEDIEKKSQIYYLNSKEEKAQKQQKTDFKQSNLPMDLDERAKEIREQQERVQKLQKQLEYELEKLEEESQGEPQHSKTEVSTKQQQKEHKRLEKLQARKNRIEERRKRSEEKKRRKEQKLALKKKQKLQLLKQKENHKKQKSNKKSHAPPSMDLDEDLKKVLRMTDSLLEELPDEVINQFVNSEDFILYERVLNKYKVYERVINKHRIK
jgi:hypothetical protein